jgi:histidinol-phosphate/aromatic aminotransferase/cobyric acid decarboxylase-like protein
LAAAYPSAANFIFAKSQKPNLWQELLTHGILVRQFMINKEEFVRFTVGKPEENQQLVDVLASF